MKIFNEFKNIITLENTIKLEILSYSTDYEIALNNALEKVFPYIRHLG